jgi:two-component system sensor histidine kinase KdpD
METECPNPDRLAADSPAEELNPLREAGDLPTNNDVGEASPVRSPWRLQRPVAYGDYLATALIVVLCGLIGFVSRQLQLSEANIVMIFLAGVAFAAARFGRGPAILAAVFGVLVFDFFFIPPIYAFAPSDAQYFVTLSVMLGIGLLISTLTSRLQYQLLASQQQEYRTSQLYRMTRQLSTLAGTECLVQTASQLLMEMFPGEVALFFRETDGSMQLRFGHNTPVAQHPVNITVAQWVLDYGRTAGLGTDTFPNATALFVPMVGAQRTVGALGVLPHDTACFLDTEQRQMLETCASLVALSIERDQSFIEAQQAQLQVQSEQLRNSLLSAVSHDLRTPLATIAVTASSLLEDSTEQSWPLKLDMVQTVVDESRRLARQVDNLLGMARLNSGTIVLHREWEVLEDLVGVALMRLRRELKDHRVNVHIRGDFPLLWVAGDLIELVLVNLLDNAIRYTPAGSSIEITAANYCDRAEIKVADNGPGLPPNSESKVFEKFFRGRMLIADGQRGIGLGLSICQAIIHAHGGQVSAGNRVSGGAELTIFLPCSRQSPQVTLEETSDTANA